MPETPSIDIFPKPPDPDVAIEITNGIFAWESADFKSANQDKSAKSTSMKNKLDKCKPWKRDKKEFDENKMENLIPNETQDSLVKVLFDIKLKIPKVFFLQSFSLYYFFYERIHKNIIFF